MLVYAMPSLFIEIVVYTQRKHALPGITCTRLFYMGLPSAECQMLVYAMPWLCIEIVMYPDIANMY
jgi:hypothetical protein